MWSKTDSIALHRGVISAPAFVGAGVDDLSVTGSPGFAALRSYRVVIDSVNNTFKWSNDGGATFEETGVPIQARVTYPLRNAEGELEGISLIFTTQAGHTNADLWNFTTTGTVVANAETDLAFGLVVNSRSADGMIIHGQYAKGAEDGLQLKVDPKMRGKVSSYNNVISLPLNLGNGGLRHQEEYFEMTATSNYTYRVNLLGVGAFVVRQVRSGAVGATGLFTCYADLYKVLR